MTFTLAGVFHPAARLVFSFASLPPREFTWDVAGGVCLKEYEGEGPQTSSLSLGAGFKSVFLLSGRGGFPSVRPSPPIPLKLESQSELPGPWAGRATIRYLPEVG
jgi:hypothetical protein